MSHSTDHSGASHGSVKTYMTGFILSIILTVIPFWMVMTGAASPAVILGTILAMAVVQVLVHLVCFLHMNTKSDEGWNMTAFVFTVLIIAYQNGAPIRLGDVATVEQGAENSWLGALTTVIFLARLHCHQLRRYGLITR